MHILARHPAPRRTMEGLMAWLGLSLAAGCASLHGDDARRTAGAPAWAMEPVFNVSTPARVSSAGRGYYTLGRYYDGSRDWEPAERAYRRALAIDPDYPDALDALGVLLGRTGRAGEAEALLRRAVTLAPERASLRNNLGYLLLANGRPAEAERELAASVAADGNDAVAQANLRVARARLDDATASAAAQAPTTTAAANVAPTAPALSEAQTLAFTSAPSAMVAPPPAADAAQTAHATTTPWGAETLALARAPVRRLEISNGNGVPGMAAQVGRLLARQGLPSATLSNASSFTRQDTLVQYRPDNAEATLRVANSLPAAVRVEASLAPQASADVRVLLGHDWVTRAACLQREDCRPLVVAAGPKATLR